MTNEDDAVFDPYMGVGSAMVGALKHNRRAYGCDIVREYVEIARQRVRALHAGTLRTRPMGKPVYDPTLPNGGVTYHFCRPAGSVGRPCLGSGPDGDIARCG